MPLTPQQLARLCHEADRVLCSLQGDARHARWLRQRRDAGWSYGPVRSIPGKTDPALLEYGALPSERRMRGTLFGAIVRVLRMPTAEEASRRPTPGAS